jgi:DNA-binding NarL/FixJ family response regulator
VRDVRPIRVLLVDDHPLFRQGLAHLLERKGGFAIVGEANDGADAVQCATKLRPDVVLMDVHMPRMNGIEAARAIAAKLPETRIVMLTVSDEDRNLFEAIKAGAHGYVLKTSEPDALVALLRGVVRGEAGVSRVTAARILKAFANHGSHPRDAARGEDLTPREREVLQLLVSGRTNKEIGGALDIAENTVKNHLKNVLAKLHTDNRVQAVAVAIEHGLVLPPSADKRTAPPTKR